MASVTRKPMGLRITDAQRVGSSLLVSFDDGVEALFEPQFLYENKQTNGNRVVDAEEDPD